ncbi:hypothetical protein TNCV_1335011 [Trichonephila clavipes]|nr:hypothetical protein TNCV_1335011 [Trichonephila clavipes]
MTTEEGEKTCFHCVTTTTTTTNKQKFVKEEKGFKTDQKLVRPRHRQPGGHGCKLVARQVEGSNLVPLKTRRLERLMHIKSAMAFKMATRGLLMTDLVILNHGQVTRTTPEMAPPSPNFHTPLTEGRFSSRHF